MDIRETSTTFHGRKVIQVDEIFFVDAEISTSIHEAQWVSDQRANLFYKGCVYNRLDHTGEFHQFAHPDFVPPSDEEVARAFTEAGFEDVEIHSAVPDCQHAA